MSNFDRNRIIRLRKTLHKQTNQQTDTTKMMVTWPWTNNASKAFAGQTTPSHLGKRIGKLEVAPNVYDALTPLLSTVQFLHGNYHQHNVQTNSYNKLCYRRGTARRAMSVEISSTAGRKITFQNACNAWMTLNVAQGHRDCRYSTGHVITSY